MGKKVVLNNRNREVFQRYHDDLRMLFLKRFDSFCKSSTHRAFDKRVLLDLFDEVLYVKSLLEKDAL